MKEIMVYKFKCVHSGTIVEFFTEHDAEVMRNHPEYEEVVDEPKPAKKQAKTSE